MLNTELRKEQLNKMKVAELKELAAKGYGFKVSGKKAEIIEEILNYEWDLYDEELQAANDEVPTWWNLVCEMNMKDGQPFVYEHVSDRPLLQQIMLYVVRDLCLDTKRAIKVANGKAEKEERFGPVFIAKNYNNEFRMKDVMAKSTVKTAAIKVLSKEQQQKFIVDGKFKQASQVLERLDNAGLIHGDCTDKEYAKFYTVHPEEMLAFLEAVGCLKK